MLASKNGRAKRPASTKRSDVSTKDNGKPSVADCQIWQCQHADLIEAGLLVTEPGRLDRLVGFVPSIDGAAGADELATARAIVDAPAWLAFALFDPTAPAIDLRPYGRLDSICPTPRWIYSLRCRPHGSEAEFASLATPFCRHMLADMVSAEAALRKEESD